VLTDLSFLACAKKLLAATDAFYPQFATHNALTATMVREMAGDYDDYELQRLHGMGEALHDRLIERGARSRIYAPVGGHKELLPYLVRRLLENGANSSFVNQLIDPDLSVDDIVADPFDEIEGLESLANPQIPDPRDHLNNGRLSAKGWDETHPPMAANMSPAMRKTLAPIAARPIINGVPVSGVISPVTNPANIKDAVGSVEVCTSEDVERACAAAAGFAKEWASTPVTTRAGALRRAADLLEQRGAHFMTLAIFEAGKNWPDAIAELREAVDFLRYYADEAEDLPPLAKGRSKSSISGGDQTASKTGSDDSDPPLAPPFQGGEQAHVPLGVVACISPWNFPPWRSFWGKSAPRSPQGTVLLQSPPSKRR